MAAAGAHPLLFSPLAGGTAQALASSLVVVEWTAPAGTSREHPIAGLHVHHGDDEAWYVLEGRLGFVLAAGTVEAGPGDCVLAPRGTPHAYWNAGTDPARYLLVLSRRLAELVEAVHAPGVTDFAEVFRRYASELL